MLSSVVPTEVLLNLLRTEAGQKELQEGGSYFGIEIKTPHWNNIIDYGNVQSRTLPLEDTIPIGKSLLPNPLSCYCQINIHSSQVMRSV
jgi:hypothetical protein